MFWKVFYVKINESRFKYSAKQVWFILSRCILRWDLLNTQTFLSLLCYWNSQWTSADVRTWQDCCIRILVPCSKNLRVCVCWLCRKELVQIHKKIYHPRLVIKHRCIMGIQWGNVPSSQWMRSSCLVRWWMRQTSPDESLWILRDHSFFFIDLNSVTPDTLLILVNFFDLRQLFHFC